MLQELTGRTEIVAAIIGGAFAIIASIITAWHSNRTASVRVEAVDGSFVRFGHRELMETVSALGKKRYANDIYALTLKDVVENALGLFIGGESYADETRFVPLIAAFVRPSAVPLQESGYLESGPAAESIKALMAQIRADLLSLNIVNESLEIERQGGGHQKTYMRRTLTNLGKAVARKLMAQK